MESIKRYEVRLSGSGGQGLVTAGIILAHAAILDGKNAVQTQVYGPESRGGACRSEVVIADREIDFPQVTKPDACLVMSQESYDRFAPDIKPGGVVVVDTTFIQEKELPPEINVCAEAITEITKRRLKTTIPANMVALTLLNSVISLVEPDNLLRAILTRVPVKFADLNRDAFLLGQELSEGFTCKSGE